MTAVLLGEWGFLDNLNDTSGRGINATANFTPSYVNGPQANTRAINFSADGQTVTYGRTGLEPTSADGGICMMAWVKLSASSTGYLGVIHKHRDPSSFSTRAGCDLIGNKFRPFARWRDQLAFADGIGPDLNDNTWHHLCVVDADDRYEWYIDGVSVQSATRTGTGSVTWEPYPWFSGFTSDMHSSSLLSISGMRIFSGSLTTAEVNQWKNTPISSSTSGVIVGGVKKPVASKSVIVGGTKKPVSGTYIIVNGQKKQITI
ncbi:hypothetical protein SEA_ENYGMA_53 [Streptomyces phage Enygma]